MPYETCWACNKYVSSLVFVCGTLFCYVNFETMCELCRHSWLPNICVYGLYLCCKGNEFYILCWAVYVSMCVHLAISNNFRILGTHICVHLAIASDPFGYDWFCQTYEKLFIKFFEPPNQTWPNIEISIGIQTCFSRSIG